MKQPSVDMQQQYEVLINVQASVGDGKIYIGQKGACRYCLQSSGISFSQVAHAFPESLGNKWVISRDECDGCNQLFSIYEGALADSVAPFLTLGGTKGKGNAIRQTGRSAGSTRLTRDEAQDRPHISAFSGEIAPENAFRLKPSTDEMILRIPIAGVPFRPRHAYKALCRMALAIMPEEYLPKYETMRKWLLDRKECELDHILDVAISFGSIGNAPPVAAGILLKRTDPDGVGPELLFQFCAGSVCLQINLRGDSESERRWKFGAVNIHWKVILEGNDGESLLIDYGNPTHFDWSRYETVPQPVEALDLYFHPKTCAGRFVPILRKNTQSDEPSFLPNPNPMSPPRLALTQAPVLQPVKSISDGE